MAVSLHLLVRFVHVVGMAVLLGGAAVMWSVLRGTDEELLSVLVQYEWVFWGTVGVMVVTGIGNLGALGAPGPRTRWGTVLSIKLLVVLLFVVGSFLRTLTVFRLYERESLSPANSALQRWYGATAWTLVGVVALAEFLAHG